MPTRGGVELVRRLAAALSPDRVRSSPADRIAYDCDGTARVRSLPAAIVFPETGDEVAAVLAILRDHGVPWVGRGAGTGLSGGAVAGEGGVVVSTARMRRILSLDAANRRARVEPGVVNAQLSAAAAPHGLHYAPDPSSQASCTLGGNLAENSGGPHTLKYGVTTQHVLAATVVLSTGETVPLGGRGPSAPGLDLLGVLVGSEGTLGIVTELTVRLTPTPPSWRTLVVEFETVDEATRAISAIIAAGIVPAALEMLDGVILEALNRAFDMDFPLDVAALLLVEVDGLEQEVEADALAIEAICGSARRVVRARDARERAQLWRARKQAFGALGRISAAYYTQDGVVPRTKLPEVLDAIARIGEAHGLRIANVFHAGDGNLHPCILYDPAVPGMLERVEAAGAEVLDLCLSVGGSLTGEHGIGLEKRAAMPKFFTDDDLWCMDAVRRAFDPLGLANPGKILPTPGACAEARAQARGAASARIE